MGALSPYFFLGEKQMPYKSGLNITDMNRCKAYVEQGHTTEQISRFLQVKLEIVSKFVEHYKGGNAAKKRPVDCRTEDDVKAQKKAVEKKTEVEVESEASETEKPVKASSRKRG